MKNTAITKISILLTIFFIIGIFSGCIITENNNSTSNGNSVPDTGENFSFELTDGTTAELKDFRGKIVILDMWATWCSPCQYQMIELKKAYEDYSRKDLEILSINIDSRESNSDIESFLNMFSENGYNLDWVFANEIDDTSQYKKKPDSGIPSICFFNRNGEILYKHVGVMMYNELPDGWTGDKTLLKDKIDEFI